MSRYYDDDGDYERSRGRRHSPPPQFRDRSPDYHYSGGASQSQARLQYEPQSPFYPPDGGNTLQVPQSRHRPRSMPPMSSGAIVPRGRRSHSPASSGSEDERDRSPLAKARHALKDTFSQSNSGLGVGVLGAIVGGIAAREASEATLRARGKSHSGDHDKSTLVSTLIGAAVGGLGANALEKRLESAKKKDEEKREEDGRKSHGPIRGANADYYDNDDYDYVYDRKTRHRRSDDRY